MDGDKQSPEAERESDHLYDCWLIISMHNEYGDDSMLLKRDE